MRGLRHVNRISDFVSGWQLAQGFVDLRATRFQLMHRIVGRLVRTYAVERHFEASEFDHQIMAQKEWIDAHGGDTAHGGLFPVFDGKY